jgi:hypothetical protein
MVHRRMIERVLGRLDEDRARYFGGVLRALDEDSRAEFLPNLVFLVLRESIQLLPVYLPQEEFLDRLFAFVAVNKDRLMRLIHSPRYIQQPACVREITNEFVVEVVDQVLARYRRGEIDSGERAVHRVQWPYDEIEFPYADDSSHDDD